MTDPARTWKIPEPDFLKVIDEFELIEDSGYGSKLKNDAVYTVPARTNTYTPTPEPGEI